MSQRAAFWLAWCTWVFYVIIVYAVADGCAGNGAAHDSLAVGTDSCEHAARVSRRGDT